MVHMPCDVLNNRPAARCPPTWRTLPTRQVTSDSPLSEVNICSRALAVLTSSEPAASYLSALALHEDRGRNFSVSSPEPTGVISWSRLSNIYLSAPLTLGCGSVSTAASTVLPPEPSANCILEVSTRRGRMIGTALYLQDRKGGVERARGRKTTILGRRRDQEKRRICGNLSCPCGAEASGRKPTMSNRGQDIPSTFANACGRRAMKAEARYPGCRRLVIARLHCTRWMTANPPVETPEARLSGSRAALAASALYLGRRIRESRSSPKRRHISSHTAHTVSTST